MNARHDDGSAGDADYGRIGVGYADYRRPDPRIAAFITDALGDSETVLNLGAGAGSYEPIDRQITAVEPSATMRANRPPHLATAIDAVAERLPFEDKSFDATLATFTVHQWSDLATGLTEMRRVTRGPVVVLTCDPDELAKFVWLQAYLPEVIAVEAMRYPPIETIARGIGERSEIVSIPIPLDCTDGFTEAYYGRPELLLDTRVREACSAWSFLEPTVLKRFSEELARDLASGAWDARFGHWRFRPSFDGSLKLVIGKD